MNSPAYLATGETIALKALLWPIRMMAWLPWK